MKRYECLERVQLYAFKRYMNVGQRACNAAVLGDCNRPPMFIQTAKRALKYWFKILNMPQDRYVKKCYNMLINDDKHGQKNYYYVQMDMRIYGITKAL